VSINGAAPAPRLATIDWYKQHNDGLTERRPAVRDRPERHRHVARAARPLGHEDAAIVPPAIEVAEHFVLPLALARSMATTRKPRLMSTMKAPARRQGSTGGRRLPEPGRGTPAQAPDRSGEGRGG
jgi:hypothetical protein